MHHIDATHYHRLFDRSIPPILTVNPGEEVAIDTLDACYNRVRTVDEFLNYRAEPKPVVGDPITGPVYIKGATPGGTLVVDILKVELNDEGFQLIGPNRAIVKDEVPEWDCYRVRVKNNRIIMPHGIELPADPVVGTLGCAPAGEPNNHPSRMGYNIDVPQVRTGARVYLPVEVEGGLFFVGDVHARQGDGEVVGAPEIGARITVKFSILDHAFSNRVMIEDADAWHVVACGPTERDAIRAGTFECARFVERTYGVHINDALILLTMMVQLHVSRIGGWGKLEPTVCVGFPKALMREATARYKRQ